MAGHQPVPAPALLCAPGRANDDRAQIDDAILGRQGLHERRLPDRQRNRQPPQSSGDCAGAKNVRTSVFSFRESCDTPFARIRHCPKVNGATMRHLLVIGLMLLLSLPRLSTPAYSMFTSKKTATWNLQGAGHATDNKWSNQVSTMTVGPDAVNILGLQEAGSPPPSAQFTWSSSQFFQPDNLTTPVTAYLWQVRRNEYRYIYFSDNDAGAHRVNVAIVTDEIPDEVVILRPQQFSERSSVTWRSIWQ